MLRDQDEISGAGLDRGRSIRTDTDRDFILSAQEAKDYGIVDEVIRRRPAQTVPFESRDEPGPNGGGSSRPER